MTSAQVILGQNKASAIGMGKQLAKPPMANTNDALQVLRSLQNSQGRAASQTTAGA